MGKFIGFINQKGGVGKTTTCVNLSAYLAESGKKVLLVDLDPQGNATSGVGIVKNPRPMTVYNVIDGEVDVLETIKKTNIANLDIIPSTIDLAGAEYDLATMINRERVIKRILEPIRDKYDVITIDCPPSLGQLTVNALSCADSLVIPIQCEFYALEGLTQLMNTIKLVKQHINEKLDIEGVVLTMYDGRSNLMSEVSNEIRKFFKQKVFKTVIPRNVKLAEAPSFGMPICKYDANCAGGAAYKELTAELIERIFGNEK